MAEKEESMVAASTRGARAAGFHAKDGWYFRRLPGGAVDIVQTAPTGAPVILAAVRLDPDTWASIVASVSVGGEDAERWRQARAFHQGGAGA